MDVTVLLVIPEFHLHLAGWRVLMSSPVYNSGRILLYRMVNSHSTILHV